MNYLKGWLDVRIFCYYYFSSKDIDLDTIIINYVTSCHYVNMLIILYVIKIYHNCLYTPSIFSMKPNCTVTSVMNHWCMIPSATGYCKYVLMLDAQFTTLKM